ncbi:cobalt ABC transporter permease [Pararhodobacter marinus]|uniref:Cobalt ABC transporter permease n=1 Tax=Pararhodobacter marinus TaxID=2184063 RepID=A0A2U2CD39_9RHOB|nr:cobalt ABC transporter permease [Pararhodobacter marinus]PWE29762.1 cobalt ABC transporter permease [Pararhodobacter marinus]
MMRALIVTLVLLMPLPAFAHNVIASVFPSGSAIEGEIGFSNGEMATGQVVEVFDQTGTKLGETVTDGDGFFLYTPTAPVTHVFRANLGAGHVAEMAMPADEVAAILGVAAPEAAQPATALAGPAAGQLAAASLTQEERQAIAEIVRTEMRPLRQEITAYRNHNDLQTILGGIGYIAGLFGLGFYLAARRRLAA